MEGPVGGVEIADEDLGVVKVELGVSLGHDSRSVRVAFGAE